MLVTLAGGSPTTPAAGPPSTNGPATATTGHLADTASPRAANQVPGGDATDATGGLDSESDSSSDTLGSGAGTFDSEFGFSATDSTDFTDSVTSSDLALTGVDADRPFGLGTALIVTGTTLAFWAGRCSRRIRHRGRHSAAR